MSKTDDPARALDVSEHLAFLERALSEDRAREDVTTAVLVPAERQAVADLRVKAPGILCGLPLVEPVFHLLDETVRTEALARDGDAVGAGVVVMVVRGPARAILQGERTVLNVVQRLSGIATRTGAFVERTLATGVGIYDTRKTTPGWRVLEKYAVRCGGGRNHRMDLADAAMVKENHLVAAHGCTGPEAVSAVVGTCMRNLAPGTPLFVEVENQAELEAAVEAAGDARGDLVIMLDDMELGAMRAAVNWLRSVPPPRPQLEATGGVTQERVEALASTGVQRLSAGSLTHSAPALDMSLKLRGGGGEPA